MHGYLRHLANFARVVEAGSMKSASDMLGIAPSGLSESIKVLESRFGTALLIRHKVGVTPTTEGERVYKSAAGIVDLLNEALGADEADEPAGTCRISVPSEVAATCLTTALSYLSETRPKLRLNIFAEDEFIDHSRFARDYFIRVAPKFDPRGDLKTIWQGRAHAILVAGQGIIQGRDVDDLKAIAALPAIVGTKSRPPHGYPLSNPKGRLSFERTIAVSHPGTQLSLAMQGHGVTGCLDICASEGLRSGALRHILKDRFTVPLEIRLLTPHRRKMPFDAAFAEAMDRMMASVQEPR